MTAQDKSPQTDMREALKAAVEKHCHCDTRWPATARLDDSHVDAFAADVRAALAAPVEPVAWQYRVMFDRGSPREHEWCNWQDCNEEYYHYLANQIIGGRSRLQIRALHDHATSPRLDRERLARTLYRRLVLNPPADFDDASADLQNEWLQLADAIMRETR